MGIKLAGVTTAVAAVTLSLLTACETPPAPAARVDIQNSGAEQAAPNIVSKTFAAPVGDVRTAVLKSLLRMEVKVTTDSKTDHGWKITALADELSIVIQLETLNPTTTRMRIIIAQGGKGWDEKITEIVLRLWDAVAPPAQLRAA